MILPNGSESTLYDMNIITRFFEYVLEWNQCNWNQKHKVLHLTFVCSIMYKEIYVLFQFRHH